MIVHRNHASLMDAFTEVHLLMVVITIVPVKAALCNHRLMLSAALCDHILNVPFTIEY